MRFIALFALFTFAADQLSKAFVVRGLDLLNRGAIDVFPPLLNFRMAWNRGVNFGLLSSHSEATRWALAAVAVLVSLWVVLWARRDRMGRHAQIAAGLLIGGALANALDRVIYGAVADFINVSCCGLNNPFAFNIADVGIFAGAAGIFLFAGEKKTP